MLGSLVVGPILPAHAEKFKGTKSFSLDSGYVPFLVSNRSMWEFGIEWEYFGMTLFDAVGEETFVGKSFPTRLLWAFAMPLGWMYPQYSFFVANHELGHGTRVAASGTTPIYAWNNGGNHTSIFSFFAVGLGQYGNGATTSSGGGGGATPSNWTLALSQGGMNNSMMFAEALEDEVASNGGHINQIMAYYRAKFDPYNYANTTDQGVEGDVSVIRSAYAAQGIAVSTSDLRTGSMVAMGLSATAWSYFLSVGRYVGTGDPNVSAPSIGAFRLPNFSFFQNRDGLSYRARAALDFSDYTLPFSVETIFRGRTVVEASFGYQGRGSTVGNRRGGFGTQGYFNTRGGFGAKFSHEFQAGGSTAFALGGSLMSANLLEGERNSGRWLNTSLALDFWTRLKFLL
ncbi:MAG: hypothetical protein AB7F66_00595 [Bacteriovoracia bacterium]